MNDFGETRIERVTPRQVLSLDEVMRQERVHKVTMALCQLLDSMQLRDWSFTMCAWKRASQQQPIVCCRNDPLTPPLQTIRETAQWMLKCADAAERGDALPFA